MPITNYETGKQYRVEHFATGGTLDSHWSPSKDTAVPNQSTIVRDYLQAVRLPSHSFEHNTLFLKDSRDITSADKRMVTNHVSESSHTRILVTSGTYLMADIANSISRTSMFRFFDRLNKQVVITGSIIPLKGYLQSDAGFNLGMSVACLQQDGIANIALVMNGMCLDALKGISKDLTNATFESNAGEDILPYRNFDLVTIGGSMDFTPDGLDNMTPLVKSAVPDFLRNSVNIQRPFSAVNPYVKDSRELKSPDFDLVIDVLRESTSEHILVTAGTYQIQKLRKFIQANLGPQSNDRKIVLTGSRMPLGATDMTDAPFNLGYALGKLGFVEKGINIALNGMLIGENDSIFTIYTEKERVKLKELGIIGD